MSVSARKYGNGTLWEADVIVDLSPTPAGKIRRRKRRFRTRTAALAWGKSIEREIAQRGHSGRETEAPRMNELLLQYLEVSRKLGGRRGKAGSGWIRQQEAAYRKWIGERLGDLRVDEIGSRHLDRLASDMVDAGRRPKTVRNVLQTVRGMLTLAKRYGHVREIPEFPYLHVERPRAEVHTFEQACKLLERAGEGIDPASPVVIGLGLHAGLRAGEILGLQWGDIDLDAGCLHVRRSITADGEPKEPKTQAGIRTVPLTPTLAEILRTYPRRLPWVFWGDDGQPATHKWLKVRVAPLLRKDGLVSRSPLHTLRKTFCTQCRLRAIPDIQVKRWMGHAASQDVTDLHYTGDFPLHVQRSWIERLEEPPGLVGGPAVANQWRGTGTAEGSDAVSRG